MKLREYRRSDLKAVLALFYETVHAIDAEAFTPDQLNAWAPASPDESMWDQRLASSSTFVAEHDGRIIGFGNVTLLGLIDTLYVHQPAQKTGVGGAILMRLIAEAKCRGLRKVQTEVNVLARPFFQSQGFIVVREQTKQLDGVAFRMYVMSMDIAMEEFAEDNR